MISKTVSHGCTNGCKNGTCMDDIGYCMCDTGYKSLDCSVEDDGFTGVDTSVVDEVASKNAVVVKAIKSTKSGFTNINHPPKSKPGRRIQVISEKDYEVGNQYNNDEYENEGNQYNTDEYENEGY